MILFTHDGRFHCDEVCAIAILRQLYPEAEIVRTRDLERLDGKSPEDLVVDVGGKFVPEEGRFDHHQSSFDLTFFPDPMPQAEEAAVDAIEATEEGAKEAAADKAVGDPKAGNEPAEAVEEKHRPARIPMSSAGLVWKFFASRLLKGYPQWFELDEEEREMMTNRLYAQIFRQIDAHDNGVQPHVDVVGYNYAVTLNLGATVGKMNSAHHSDDALQMKCFQKAVEYAWITLDTWISSTLDRYLQVRPTYLRIWPMLRPGMEILEVPEEFPLLDAAVMMWEQDTRNVGQVKFVVMPKKDQWKISTLPDPNSLNFFDRREYLLPAEEYPDLSEEVVFVHKNLFCGAARTPAAAREMWQRALSS